MKYPDVRCQIGFIAVCLVNIVIGFLLELDKRCFSYYIGNLGRKDNYIISLTLFYINFCITYNKLSNWNFDKTNNV